MTNETAANRLGVSVAEVADVASHPHGVAITTTDGVTYLDVPAGKPDADGKTGLMFLRLPRPGMLTDFPVFADGEPEPEPADAVDEGAEPSSDAGELPPSPAPVEKAPAKKAAKKAPAKKAAKKAPAKKAAAPAAAKDKEDVDAGSVD